MVTPCPMLQRHDSTNRRRLVPLVAGAVLLAAACEPVEPETGESRLALGEPRDGFPNWSERVIHQWTNRARCSPSADLAACADCPTAALCCAEADCYDPVPPLVWSHNLARSSRFHSANLVRTGASLRHDSPCTLVPTIRADYVPGPCNGDESCACVGGVVACRPTCTTWDERIELFGGTPAGENVAYGSADPNIIFYLWLRETDTNAACGFRHANGHRYSILSSANHAMGSGLHSTTYTQDFGPTGTPSGVVSGVHYPQTGTSLQLWASWYSTAGAPLAAWVNVDGTCHAMTRRRGTGTNGAWRADVTLSAGDCHRYYFRFTGPDRTVYDYPTTGSFGINCTDWTSTRPAACCLPICTGRVCGTDGCGGSCGACPTGSDTACRRNTCRTDGTCAMTNVADGTACNDGRFCTATDACTAGACTGTGSPCRAGPCLDSCNETTNRCIYDPAGTVCRAAAGACDIAETCSGTASACPADAFRPATRVCRAATGDCDLAENCTGTVAACPSDSYSPIGTPCGTDLACDGAGACVPTGADADADADADAEPDAEPDADAEADADADADAEADATDFGPGCVPDECDRFCRELGSSGGTCVDRVRCVCAGTGDATGDAPIDGGPDGYASTGCSCSFPARSADEGWLLLGLTALAAVRRRRPSPRSASSPAAPTTPGSWT
ncbi:MAG: hypothetical protein JXB32_22480 [Deltaproteobacteria bacterium]|nr:hypothetical protein [Deltaproteobacteria bacterium]